MPTKSSPISPRSWLRMPVRASRMPPWTISPTSGSMSRVRCISSWAVTHVARTKLIVRDAPSAELKQAARLLFGARVGRLSDDEVFQEVQERQGRSECMQPPSDPSRNTNAEDVCSRPFCSAAKQLDHGEGTLGSRRDRNCKTITPIFRVSPIAALGQSRYCLTFLRCFVPTASCAQLPTKLANPSTSRTVQRAKMSALSCASEASQSSRIASMRFGCFARSSTWPLLRRLSLRTSTCGIWRDRLSCPSRPSMHRCL